MANVELVRAIKEVIGLANSGHIEQSYVAYKNLFASEAFAAYRPEDRRQALKLMILAKGAPSPSMPALVEAHRAAVAPLTAAVEALADPADYELLGICQLVMGNEEAASTLFRAGLTLERQRNPQSDLCGALMRRVSLL